jgi:histidine triad (HIT) family protein
MAQSQECVFCKIIRREIPSKVVYEDDKAIAFHDINPNAPVHVLVIPKEHIYSLNQVNDENIEVVAHIFKLIPRLAEQLGVNESGYRVVVNCGKDSGMAVGHLHFHILGGKMLSQTLA